MRRFSVRPLFGFIALIGFSLTPVSAFAQHGGGGGHSGGSGGGSHGGGAGGFHSSGPSSGGAYHGSAGASRGGAYGGARSGAGASGRGGAESGRSLGAGRGVSSASRSASAGSSNIRPAINDGQWHSFGSAGSTRASASSTNSTLVAHSTGFNGRSFGGEPAFGIGGGFRGGWGGGWGGGWRGGCCWGGFGFGWGWGWPYWGPAWGFAWNPWWYSPYGYGPYGYGYGYGYDNYSDSAYGSGSAYSAPPYRSEVLSEYDKENDSPAAYLNRPSDDDNKNDQTSQPEAAPSGQSPVAAQTNPSLL